MEDTSSFSVVSDITVTMEEINNDLIDITNWVYQWKMSFHSNLTKQKQEVTSPKLANRLSQFNF